MKYLQKGPFSVGGGLSNYDEVFGRKCFYCRKPIDKEAAPDEWENNAHRACDPDRKEKTA